MVGRAHKLDIRGGVAVVRDVTKLITLNGLLGTVVFLVAGILGNSNDHLVGNRRHLKLAGLVRDAVVGGLGAVLEHDAVLRHVAFGFADVGDGAVDHGGRDTVLAHEALSRELVLRFGGSQREPVVSPGRRAGSHGYLSRLDGQRARGDADGELLRHIVAVRTGHPVAVLAAGDDIVVGASIRARNARIVVGNGVLNAIEGPRILLHVGHRVLFAVIARNGIALARQRDGILLVIRTMLHRQRSRLSGDAVVISVRPILELPAFVLDGAGGGAALRPRALHGNVGDALALNEAVRGELRVSLVGGQRAAVIFLFR